ncbi:MAG: sialidase family protein [Alphaproteobacteria bacterium]
MEDRAEFLRDLLGVDDLDALSDQLRTLRRAQRKECRWARREYDPGGSLPPEGIEVVSLDPEDSLTIVRARRPRKALASWGLVGRCVKVRSPAPFGFARIRFALPKNNTRHLFSGTIVAALWDSGAERFRLVPASGYNETGAETGAEREPYVFAQITRPGIYTAVGLPRDPRALLVLRLLDALAPWAEAAALKGRPLVAPLLKTLARQSLVRTIAKDPTLLEALGRTSHGFVAQTSLLEGIGCDEGDLDELARRLPELDLLELVGAPSRMIAPMPDPRLPDEWPVPRGRWECLGPANVTGRIKVLAIHPERGRILYAGAAGGGVWKTNDGGGNWFPTMHDERSLAIGGLAVAPSSPEVLYAATGEWTGNSERPETPSGMGGGVYRSSDGARHWHLCGGIDSTMCMAVAVHPEDADRVLVGGNRGLHRSDYGGLTWRTIGKDDGAQPAPRGPLTSVVVAHDNPNLVLAGVHRRGVYRSEDGGRRWHLLTPAANGLPDGEVANAPKIALGRNGKGGSGFVTVKMGDAVYASHDGGQHFTFLSDMPDGASSMIAWCNLVAAHPENDSILFAGGTNLHRSDDGGATWSKVGGYGTSIHEDQQFIVFDPNDADRVFLANDGGVWVSNDGGLEWEAASRGLVAAQTYDISVSDGPALRFGASLHDASAHISDGGGDWTSLGWGEGGSLMFVPGRSDEVYADSQWSNLMRFRRRPEGDWEAIDDGPDTALNADQPLAASRTRPYELLAVDADRRSLLRRRPGRSPDWSSALQLRDAKFTSVAIALSDHRIAYAGDTKSRIWHSSDAGTTWAQLCGPQCRGGAITTITVSRWDAHRFYVCIRHGEGSTICRGDVAGETCALCPLPSAVMTGEQRGDGHGGFAAILEGRYEDALLAIREKCIVYSFDGGMSWQEDDNSLPKVRLMRGVVREADWTCFVATHGAGVFRRAI